MDLQRHFDHDSKNNSNKPKGPSNTFQRTLNSAEPFSAFPLGWISMHNSQSKGEYGLLNEYELNIPIKFANLSKHDEGIESTEPLRLNPLSSTPPL